MIPWVQGKNSQCQRSWPSEGQVVLSVMGKNCEVMVVDRLIRDVSVWLLKVDMDPDQSGYVWQVWSCAQVIGAPMMLTPD